ncbi:MAG TPA: hypothetical protein VL921_13990, partial [Candidatus Udaeobacter sp.]|nr:hypothetical protein [Candidatus Udaeobacter sp.]
MKSYKMLVFLMLSLFLVLTACSGNSANKGSNSTAGTETSGNAAKSEEKKLKIGLTVPTLGNPFFVAMSKGAQEVAAKYNAEVTVVAAEHDL